MRLAGKVAVITGSSRGIGRATAKLFASEGAIVVVTFKVEAVKAECVVDEIVRSGGQAIAVQADVAEPLDVNNLFDRAIRAFGTVDILINNAGVLKPKPFFELSKPDIQAILDTNVIGAILCAQRAAEIMLANEHGSIVNVASISGLQGFGTPGNMHYAISKAAVINMTGVLAKALGPTVNVNCIAPGFVETDMGTSPEYIQRVRDVPLRRTVMPEEVAEVCLFLASDEAKAMTGETVIVDAGFHLR